MSTLNSNPPSAAAPCSPRVPKRWLRQAWVCLFLRRKQWKLARAASKLTCHAFNTGDDALYETMQPIQDRLWREVYVEENDELSDSGRNAQ